MGGQNRPFAKKKQILRIHGSSALQKKVQSMEHWQLQNFSQQAEAVLTENGKRRKEVLL